jgi:hypothetical protein
LPFSIHRQEWLELLFENFINHFPKFKNASASNDPMRREQRATREPLSRARGVCE